MEFLETISPALITILANFCFIYYLNNRLTKEIEQYKISYSGIFKERIDIYRIILTKTVEIKSHISKYSNGNGDSIKIMKDLNDFIDFLQINRPFISSQVNDISKKLITCFQEFFDAFHLYNKNLSSGGILNEEYEKNYYVALNKLRNNEDFKKLEDLLVSEISKSLGFDKI